MTPEGDAVLAMPAFDRGRGNAELGAHRADTPELLENTDHAATSCEVRITHPNRTFGVRQSHSLNICDFRKVPAMDGAGIIEGLKRHGVPHERIADAIGRDRTVATKLLAGTRSLKVAEMEPLMALIAEYERDTGEALNDSLQVDYVAVEVLPTFAGMGGGGTGDADRQQAMLPRSLVESELRAKPSDLLVINVRGNSMEPLFYQDDQIVVDRRDVNPIQPGPFALWDGDGYVVKNVERNPKTKKYRVFSSNPAYTDHEFDPADVQIMGRPVWYARRL